MNEEKQIAQTILDAQKLHEESYVYGDLHQMGDHKRDRESCLIEASTKNELSPNLWALLNLAMHWWNDVQLWAEDVLAGKNILDKYASKKELEQNQ